MATKKSFMIAARAREILRLALLWARRGGSFKRGLGVRSIRITLKNLRAGGSGARYLEREFSFDETPAFSFKMRRRASSRIPCISTPLVDFDNEDDWMFYKGENEAKCDDVDDLEVEEEEEIDSKAEEFIAKFYEEMKMQRQVSLLP